MSARLALIITFELSEALEAFIAAAECAESTRLAHQDYARNLVHYFGPRPVNDFAGRAGGELAAAYLRDRGAAQGKRPLAYSSVRFRLNTLRLALQHAVAEGKLESMPEPWPIPRPGAYGHANRGRYLMTEPAAPAEQPPTPTARRRLAPPTVTCSVPISPAPPGTETLHQALEWLLRQGLRRRTEPTQRMHQAHARYLEQFFGAERPITDFRGATGYRLLWELVQRDGPEEGGRGLKYVTIRKRMITLRMALNEAIKRGALDTICPWPETPTDARPRERYLTVGEYRDVRALLPERRQLWLDLGVFTGQHSSDLNTMTWGMVDLGGGPGNEPGAGAAFFWRRNTKNRARPAWVPMPAELRDNLTGLRRMMDPEPQPEECIVGPWPNARNVLRRACKKLEIAPVSPIDLRRTCATWWVERGGPKEALRKYLGHSTNSTMVERHYSQITPDMLEGGVEALDRAAGHQAGMGVRRLLAVPTTLGKDRKGPGRSSRARR